KRYFDAESRDCICPPKQPVCTCGHIASVLKITTKPITADQKQIAINPRARSAKLRAAEKINKNKSRPKRPFESRTNLGAESRYGFASRNSVRLMGVRGFCF